METIKIKLPNSKQVFDIRIDKLIYVLSRLEDNDELEFESQEQVEKLMKRYCLFDEHFLKNVNNI